MHEETDLKPASEDPSRFQVPKEQQRRIERAQKKRTAKIYEGSGNDFKSFGRVESNRDIYIFRVSKSATEEDLRDFLVTEAKLEVLFLKLVSDSS